ncbi:RING finger protein 157 isoform X8 [Sus scrofa]|uniref:RING finger protein 157 isoform X8 n=1 Tax=Sus scrofa TaxID=9823 RepID=UPI000A2B7DC0|nr:RING finger protein 157 isoform X8 [Sus scrofa]
MQEISEKKKSHSEVVANSGKVGSVEGCGGSKSGDLHGGSDRRLLCTHDRVLWCLQFLNSSDALWLRRRKSPAGPAAPWCKFPYAAPPPQEPVKTLRSLINIRKDTLRLVKCAEEVKAPGDEAGRARVHYNVEFTFDTDARVAITIYYQATEEFQSGIASYIPKDSSLQSETVHYKRGVCQQFCLPSHTVDPSEWAEEELGFDLDREVYPLVVHAVVDEGDEYFGHCHVLLGTFEKHTDGTFCVKPLKQKQVVDGVSYLLQEIYGIENKYNTQESKQVAEDEVSDNSAECVVCLSDVRDTLILPCRHLCLCNTCADTLRYQANNCPICRLPFRALLQIRAMRKKLGPLSPTSFNPIISSQTSDSEEHSSSENIPPGYEVVSLLEALNGPLAPSPAGPPLHVLGDGHLSGMLPSYGSDGHLPPVRTLSPLDRLSNCGSQGLKLKKSLSKSISQNSSVLHEEEDERSCSESETQLSQRLSAPHLGEECDGTPESENLTMSSSGAVDQSSCTGTPLSSTISSPEEPALAGQHRHRLLHVRLLHRAWHRRGGGGPALPPGRQPGPLRRGRGDPSSISRLQLRGPGRRRAGCRGKRPSRRRGRIPDSRRWPEDVRVSRYGV